MNIRLVLALSLIFVFSSSQSIAEGVRTGVRSEQAREVYIVTDQGVTRSNDLGGLTRGSFSRTGKGYDGPRKHPSRKAASALSMRKFKRAQRRAAKKNKNNPTAYRTGKSCNGGNVLISGVTGRRRVGQTAPKYRSGPLGR